MVLTVVGGSYEGHIIGYRLSTPLSSTTAPPPPVFALKAHEGCVRAVAAGGALLATSGSDHTISVYNLRKLRTQGNLLQQDGGAALDCLAFYRDSHLLSGGADGELCIWRSSDWECLMRMKGHKGAVHAVAIHPSGRVALSVAADSKLMLWNLTTGKCNYTSALSEPARIVGWSGDGELYAYESKRAVIVHGLRSGELQHTLAHETARPLAMVFATSELLVTGDDAGALRVWSLLTGQCVCLVEKAHEQRIKALTLATPMVAADEGKSASAVGGDVLIASACSDGTISVWCLSAEAGAAATKASKKAQKSLGGGGGVALKRMLSVSTRLRLTSIAMSESGGAPANGETRSSAAEAEEEEEEAAAAEEEVVAVKKKKKKKIAAQAEEAAVDEAEEQVEAAPAKKKKKKARPVELA